MHLSCVKIRAISKRTEMWFKLGLVTKEYHWVHPKRFLSLWYFYRKLCTYLASALTLSSNGPTRDSTWGMSPKSSIGCVQNDFWAYRTFGTNHAPILHQDYTINKWTEMRFHMVHITHITKWWGHQHHTYTIASTTWSSYSCSCPSTQPSSKFILKLLSIIFRQWKRVHSCFT
jgi:hypothetical protein